MQSLQNQFVKAVASDGAHTIVGTGVVGYCRGPYQLRGQPSCCRSAGRSPN